MRNELRHPLLYSVRPSARTGPRGNLAGMDPKRLVVIDGYSLLYRAFFATRYLSTSDGRPTNALFGFTQMLFTLLEKIQPSAIVVALDSPAKTFRHAEYEAYKGTRKETADELKVQLAESRLLIETLGIPSFEIVGFEADDIAGTISKQGEANGYVTTIVTGDLDALQLVDECICVLTPSKGMSETMTYDIDAVKERYGFGPEHIVDFKALKGDTSDNIPGVPGIGDKGATELIQAFGAVENLLEKFEEVPAKYQKKITGNEDQMIMCKRLATIVRDVPIQYDFKPFVLTQAQYEGAVRILESLEFRNAVRRAPGVLGPYVEGALAASSDDAGPAQASLVVDEKIEFKQSTAENYGDLAKFVDDRMFSAYFPSAGARADLFGEIERKAYVAVGTDVVECREADAAKLVIDMPQLAVLHDAKQLYRPLATGGDLALPPHFDTLLAAYVLRSERGSYALMSLIEGYLEVQPPTTGGEMAVALYRLRDPLRDRLIKEDQLRVLEEVELPLIPILAEMEHWGICADRDQLREFSKQLQVTIEATTTRVHELAGQAFNIGSPKQLGEILFDKLQIPGQKKTKTGYATGVEILSNLAGQYEIVQEVLNWRELSKLKSTYADALGNLIQADGRIHTTYNQAVAATGRLSSNDPNLQNIPIRSELGREIRKAFVPAPGFSLAGLDYSQIELRVLAHMCKEPALVDAFQRRVDVHTVTAQLMFGLGEGEASKEQRRMAKMLNYAVLYGVSEFGLAQQLGPAFGISEAKELIRLYNERFPTIKGFTESVIQEARSKGFTTTMLGRRRYFPDIHAVKMQERKSTERQAMNAPIQGTAADMLKLAMLEARKTIQGSETRMLLNVHDELVFEVRAGEEGLLEGLKQNMEVALPLSVPVEVDVKVGNTWSDMVKV